MLIVVKGRGGEYHRQETDMLIVVKRRGRGYRR